jgi:holliday junction DNA helicase RuvA
MIAYFSGIVREVRGSSLVLVVNNIGFMVQVPARYHFVPGASVELAIYTHVTQEQGLQFFGFEQSDERELFALILGCSGIGPKVALALVNGLTPAAFVTAVLTGDTRALSSVDGVGPKKAESIILQLKDKVTKVAFAQDSTRSSVVVHLKQLSDALFSLGYSRFEVTSALEQIKREGSLEVSSFDVLLRKSLAVLAKRL